MCRPSPSARAVIVAALGAATAVASTGAFTWSSPGTAGPAPARAAGRAALPDGLPAGGLSDQALAMVRRHPQAITSARFYRGIETGDIRDYDRVLARDWIDVPLALGQGRGRDGFASVLKTYHAAFPDMRVHIDEIVVAGNTVASRNTLTGTQRGPFLGVPANGRRIGSRTTDIHHIENGLIRSSYHLEDLYGAYQRVTGGK